MHIRRSTRDQASERHRPGPLTIAFGVSLLLHAGVVHWSVRWRPLGDRPQTAPTHRLELHLRPPAVSIKPPVPQVSPAPTRTTAAREDFPDGRKPPSRAPHWPEEHKATAQSAPTEPRSPAGDQEAADAATVKPTSPTSPTIDLGRAHEIARDAAREPAHRNAHQGLGSGAVTGPETNGSGADRPVLPVDPETPLGREIRRAARPDCRTRYAGAGLLAIPLLLNDAARDRGCVW